MYLCPSNPLSAVSQRELDLHLPQGVKYGTGVFKELPSGHQCSRTICTVSVTLLFIYLYFASQFARLHHVSTNCFDKLQWSPRASCANTTLNLYLVSMEPWKSTHMWLWLSVETWVSFSGGFIYLFIYLGPLPLSLYFSVTISVLRNSHRLSVPRRGDQLSVLPFLVCKQTPRPPFPRGQHIHRHAH